jgi:hypothetical protein
VIVRVARGLNLCHVFRGLTFRPTARSVDPLAVDLGALPVLAEEYDSLFEVMLMTVWDKISCR